MKKLIIVLIIPFAISVHAQIGVSRPDVANGSVSIQFSDAENRGIVLPYVIDKSSIVQNGTMIYDITDHKVKYLKDTNTWFDLSIDASGVADVSIQGNDKTEQPGAKVSIDTRGGTDTTSGILVLVDSNKAMVLPKVASPHLNIISPSAGMMVYDTTKRQLAVYNGNVWSFWKP
ncbi:hypothetical protein [Chryseobacterium polytrichastri]|uniref:Uncharacterized protein n=1 Tax=Chryseobacterium polytrichastri TaxID=1302687 RepID=A0A1M6XPA8_9FLAO|nr:hypothetical protein [Chryseobacterium polytrichastri]SHL07850.1 hypothetical protein SAMN05444267_101178 [Chryseobacterium polytrichastri]